MYYSRSLEYIVGNYSSNYSANVSYFSKIIDDNYGFIKEGPIFEASYARKANIANSQYKNQQYTTYDLEHSFTPEIFLSPERPKTKFVDTEQIKGFVGEAFEAMMKQKLPKDIFINILHFNEFKALHSGFGAWSNGILGFSINGQKKEIFARENNVDELMIVIGHEIGHVLTGTLPNRHDEEAKAFAFSIEWAKTIKKHNIANLKFSIKDEIDLKPARNGLHDVAFAFVDFMVKRGRKAIDLHDDLIKSYASIFNKLY